MARPAPTLPVSAKMYQHFAVITVGITACLALFADGEQQEEIREQISQQQETRALKAKEREMARNGTGGNSKLTIENRAKGKFGSDAPMNVTTTNTGSSPWFSEAATDPGGESMANMPRGAMSPEEAEVYRKELEQQKKARARPSKRDLENMIEASKQRSNTQSFF